MLRFFSLIFCILPFLVSANEDVISVDRVVPNSIELAFPNERNIEPELSDFQINNFILMSNDEGERFAVVTIKNLSSGSRTLNHSHLMAQVSNGARINPLPFKHAFNGDETVSLTINFGESKFPLLTVYTRTK